MAKQKEKVASKSKLADLLKKLKEAEKPKRSTASVRQGLESGEWLKVKTIALMQNSTISECVREAISQFSYDYKPEKENPMFYETITIPHQQNDTLNKIAKKNNVKKAEVLRWIITEYLKKYS